MLTAVLNSGSIRVATTSYANCIITQEWHMREGAPIANKIEKKYAISHTRMLILHVHSWPPRPIPVTHRDPMKLLLCNYI